MAAQKSAGILAFRKASGTVEFLLAHPGGPFWQRKDEGAWSIPKGLIDDGEESQTAAAREFQEEIGQPIRGRFIELTPCKQKSGKIIFSWLVEADLDLSNFRSNVFEMEWPRGSGIIGIYPEIDRVDYFEPQRAFRKILPGQKPLISEALEKLGLHIEPASEFLKEAQGSLF